MTEKRRRIWIDRFQTLLLLRIAAYCLAYQVAVWFVFAAWRQLFAALEVTYGPLSAAGNWATLALVLLVVAPVLAYDTVRFAHRLVGPLVRFRKTMRAIADGDSVSLVRLRKGDFLLGMEEDFNAMLKALEQRGLVVVTPAGEKVSPEPQLAARD